MMRFYLSLLFFGTAAAACGPTIDVGQNDGGAASDAKSGFENGDGGRTDAGFTDDGATTGSSKTKGGVSCEKADLPPAASACTIPGTYDVTESLCSSTNAMCMDVQTALDYRWTAVVTLTGTTVKLTNGTDRLMHCELTPPCTCVSTGGNVYHFTNTGFVSTGKSSCGATSVDQNELSTAVKL